jgi:PhzF family phenazine biosynthesis protein
MRELRIPVKQYRYKKIDAFTSGDSLGNPAACLFTGNERLSDSEMLCIARQHKGFVSEVVFCSESEAADCKLTYYSSECEVDFCGHGTIAAMYELIKNDDKLRSKAELVIDTNKKDRLTVYNRILEEDSVYITARGTVFNSAIFDCGYS